MDGHRVAPSALERARSALLQLTVILLGVLIVTGLLLVVLYRPPPLPEPFVQRSEPNLAVVALSPLHRVAGLLPWRLLAVSATAVAAGRGGFGGYLWALGDDVRLAIVGDTEVAPGALLLRLGVHVASAALAGAAAWLLAAARRRR